MPSLPVYACVPEPIAAELSALRFPGGASLVAMAARPYVTSGLELAKTQLNAANAALAPLQPIFDMVDAVLAVKTALDAVPDVVSNPSKLADALVKLGPKIDKLKQLVPQLSVPILVAGLLDTLILMLVGLRDELNALARAQTRITVAQDVADATGIPEMQTVVTCAQANLLTQMGNLGRGYQPVAELFMIVNLLLELAGLPHAPALGAMGSDVQAEIDRLTTLEAALRGFRTKIPL